jgi:BA14K-like protein
MTNCSRILVAALMAATAPWFIAPAPAAPLSPSLGLQDAAPPLIETVQYRRGWGGGYYRDGGFVGDGLGLAGAGIGLAGAIVGGAVVGATRPFGYYRHDSGYDYAPGYAAPYAGGSEVGYCQQRFRSYDPTSGTYLGFDGLRHSCP